MLFLSVVALTITCQTIDSSQLARLVKAARADVEDIAFVFEGGTKYPGGASVIGPDFEKREKSFQGIYVYRNDGATLLSVFINSSNPNIAFQENVHALINNKITFISRTPDMNNISKPMAGRGGRGSLNRPTSPERIFFNWLLWKGIDLDQSRYVFEGWEQVDGRRCLKVQFDIMPGMSAMLRPTVHMWIDLERGCNPLKVEFFSANRELRIRCTNIVLREYPLDESRSIWLPSRGEAHTFEWGGKNYDSPIVAEFYYLVDGLLKLNQNLPDSVFSVDSSYQFPSMSLRNRMKQETMSSRLATVRTAFDRKTKNLSESLEKAVEEADSQSKQVEAPSLSKSSWNWVASTQLIFGTIFIISLTAMIYIKKRK